MQLLQFKVPWHPRKNLFFFFFFPPPRNECSNTALSCLPPRVEHRSSLLSSSALRLSSRLGLVLLLSSLLRRVFPRLFSLGFAFLFGCCFPLLVWWLLLSASLLSSSLLVLSLLSFPSLLRRVFPRLFSLGFAFLFGCCFPLLVWWLLLSASLLSSSLLVLSLLSFSASCLSVWALLSSCLVSLLSLPVSLAFSLLAVALFPSFFLVLCLWFFFWLFVCGFFSGSLSCVSFRFLASPLLAAASSFPSSLCRFFGSVRSFVFFFFFFFFFCGSLLVLFFCRRGRCSLLRPSWLFSFRSAFVRSPFGLLVVSRLASLSLFLLFSCSFSFFSLFPVRLLSCCCFPLCSWPFLAALPFSRCAGGFFFVWVGRLVVVAAVPASSWPCCPFLLRIGVARFATSEFLVFIGGSRFNLLCTCGCAGVSCLLYGHPWLCCR